MKVFVSGTKRNIRIEDTVIEKLDALIGQHANILIGDCFGTDKCIQEYLVSRDYEDVIVYVSGDKTRHNVGDWKEVHINVQNVSKGFEFYCAKDIEMAKEADYGIAIWDGKSKGTFMNIWNLLALKKSCELYLLKEKMWIRIQTVAEIMPYVGKQEDITTRNHI